MRRTLDPHQRIAGIMLRKCKAIFGLFMAPGTGKTLTVIRFAELLDGYILIICRRDDFMTWRQELEEEGHDGGTQCMIDSGAISPPPNWEYRDNTAKRNVDRMIVGSCKHKDMQRKWVMVTYDLCKNKNLAEWIMSIDWQLVIADECQMIKRIGSARTKAVIKVTRHIPRRIAMTGSPISNNLHDLFSQCLFIDNGKMFGTVEWQFMTKYYQKSGHGWYLRKKSKDAIPAALKSLAFYVHEDDVLTLPKRRSLRKYATMGKLQKRLYAQILDEWEYELESGEIVELTHVISQIAKLRQLASGFLYQQKGDPTSAVWYPSGKLKLIHELLKDPDYLGRRTKIVIWCAHTAEILKLHEVLEYKSVMFRGSNRKQKEAARAQFRDDPKTRLFIGQVDSGVGMNELIVAKDAIYFSNSTKVQSRQQSERRIRRRGSEHHDTITYWDLITENSIDMNVWKSIHRKMDLATEILNKLKQGGKLREILRKG